MAVLDLSTFQIITISVLWAVLAGLLSYILKRPIALLPRKKIWAFGDVYTRKDMDDFHTECLLRYEKARTNRLAKETVDDKRCER